MIGVITMRHAEGYRVDIGSAQQAGLDALAFEGATKRSKPNLKVSLEREREEGHSPAGRECGPCCGESKLNEKFILVPGRRCSLCSSLLGAQLRRARN